MTYWPVGTFGRRRRRHRPSRSTVPGSSACNAWRNPVGLSVYLVNNTSAEPYGVPVHRLADAGPQKVRIRVDRLRDIRRVRLMRRGGLARWATVDAHTIEIDVPSLPDFEMITVDLEP